MTGPRPESLAPTSDLAIVGASASPHGVPPLIPEKSQRIAHARAEVVRRYLATLAGAPRGQRGDYRERFVTAYNTGLVAPELFAVTGKLTWLTVERWKRLLRSGERSGCEALVDRRGSSRTGESRLSPEVQDIILKCVLHPNRPLVSESIRLARAVIREKGIADGASDATYRRFIEGWKKLNYDRWTFAREGAKALNDKVLPYIERDYNRIEVGDVLVADGHVLNFEIINPWTGKPKRMELILWIDMKSSFPLGWEIMPTENTQAIASALRRAILRLGKIPKVAYLDNGKAFTSRFFGGTGDACVAPIDGLFERLGIDVIHAWPYHGQSKTIERFFGSFAELERFCPTYTGTDIEHKPARMMRNERVHRGLYEKRFSAGLSLADAHRAVAAWFDLYASRRQGAGSHLAETAPIEVFSKGVGPGVDRAALTFLMMSMKVATIYRNGIRHLGRNYYDPELYGRRHAVTIRYDLQDDSEILVYGEEGEFLCAAKPVERIHPAAGILGAESDQAALARQIELKRSLEKDTTHNAREFLKTDVMPEYERRLAASGITGADVIALPGRVPPAEPAALRPEQIEAAAAEIGSDPDSIWETLPGLADPERYETDLRLESTGAELPPDEKCFMRFFEDSPEYQTHRAYYEGRKCAFLEMAE